MSKEYTYDIDKYTIGVDENGEGGIGMTVAKIENGEFHLLGNCYGENARCIDLLIQENKILKDNWKIIRQYCLDEQIPEESDEYNSYIEFSNSVYDNILNKMQEITGNKLYN